MTPPRPSSSNTQSCDSNPRSAAIRPPSHSCLPLLGDLWRFFCICTISRSPPPRASSQTYPPRPTQYFFEHSACALHHSVYVHVLPVFDLSYRHVPPWPPTADAETPVRKPLLPHILTMPPGPIAIVMPSDIELTQVSPFQSALLRASRRRFLLPSQTKPRLRLPRRPPPMPPARMLVRPPAHLPR